jgi:nitrate reductase NapD
MNISSAIVQAHPVNLAAVHGRLTAIEGVEVHGASPEGKIVVTIESASEHETADTYNRISQLDGVLAAAMVFNQTESEPEEEIQNETDTA